MTRGLVLVAFVGLVACGRENRRLLPPDEAIVAVSELLYQQNLIVDDEVNARMNESVLLVSRDRRPADAVIPEFHLWLTEWARQHPDRVAAARSQGPRTILNSASSDASPDR